MSDFVTATDAMLAAFTVAWNANAPAFNGGVIPFIVYEAQETDLKPHPRDESKAWTRIVVRHLTSSKVTLVGAAGVARYRRTGLVWIQIFVPAISMVAYTNVQRLAIVAQRAYEGKRAGNSTGSAGDVCFYNVAILERPMDGSFLRYDVKSEFMWDDIH